MRAGLLIVSYSKDAEFFKYFARSYKKFARGFEWAKVVVPHSDTDQFKALAEPNGIAVEGFYEWPDKGQLHQQLVKCYGDKLFPDADVIFHADSDCVFWREMHAGEFMVGPKPLLLYNNFSLFLTEPVRPGEPMSFMGVTGERMNFNRGQYFWKFATDFALGWPAERETMAWMPIGHIPEAYKKAREIISERFGKSFEEYVRGCRNEYPQTFCEFNTLGAVAHRYYADRYIWYEVNNHRRGNALDGQGYPFVALIQVWSHGGLDRKDTFAREVGGEQTPRELYHRLELDYD